jgi:hypothetical protein
LADIMSQSAKPALHAALQRPAEHVGVALGRAGHALPHEPQCEGLVSVATSQPLSATPSQFAKPD